MEVGDATKHPTMQNTACTIRNFLAQYSSSAKVKKLNLAESYVIFVKEFGIL